MASQSGAQVALDRPRDALLVGRAEPLTGWLAPAREDVVLTGSCGGRPLLLRRCFHPVMLERADASGFWGYVFVQEHLDAIRAGRLVVELHGDGRPLATLSLLVTPSARLLACEYPLDLGAYEVPRASDATEPSPVVFPGLGGVGGATVNEVIRVQMLREGAAVPVHFEADHRPLWQRIGEAVRSRHRWIDGHACHHAGDDPARARFTLLREPARRMLSVFDYGRLVHPEAFPFASFDEFVVSRAAWRATQAVSLLRCAGIENADELSPGEIHDRAARELERAYALVGVTELFEESLLLLCRLLGLVSIGMWWRVLAAPRSTVLDELSARTRDRLDTLVAVDRALHAQATARLRALVDDAGLGDALVRYRAAAAQERALPDLLKQLECLRWRQTLVDAAVRHGASGDA
ncbi:hypothetical protein K2Z84_11325 [Candidatus Binatia bacterium]|nr:hypothetical protein [Candidatus Binatia bacterium]